MIPDATKAEFARGNIDWENDSFEAALFKNTTEYVPDPATHDFVADVFDGGTTGAEFDGSGYTPGFGGSGRIGLTNTTVTEDNTDNEAELDADDLTWSALGSATGGQIVEAVLIYAVGTSDADSRIIKVFDDSEEAALEKQTNGEDFTWQFDAEGLINLS